ncbi:MAG: phosphoribosylglycinamide formyltransferase [Eubacteriaceae bacterium]
MKKIAVFISGNGSNLQVLIDEIHKKYGIINVVISNTADAYGLKRAQDNNIKNFVLDTKQDDYDKDVLKLLEENSIELIVLAGYLKILSTKIIEKYANRIVNIHPSLIPSFCGDGFYGIKVHKKVIEYGVKVTGATVHFVDEGTDTGPIIMQDIAEVCYEDNPESLQKKVLQVEHDLLYKCIKKICEDKIIVKNRKVKILS